MQAGWAEAVFSCPWSCLRQRQAEFLLCAPAIAAGSALEGGAAARAGELA